MNSKWTHRQGAVLTTALALLLMLSACGGGDGSSPPVTDPGGDPPGNTPTRARITIQVNTSVPTIWGGGIYGKAGATSATRVQFAADNVVCGSGLPRECSWTANVGDTVTLAATDVQAEPSIGLYSYTSSPDDPRSIQSQFVSFGAPCLARERGVCAFRVTGDVTITAQFKSLTLTRFYFSGLNPWDLTVNAPPVLTLTSISPAEATITHGHYGLFSTGVSFGRCIGEAPGVRCVSVLTPDNSTIKMEAFPARPCAT